MISSSSFVLLLSMFSMDLRNMKNKNKYLGDRSAESHLHKSHNHFVKCIFEFEMLARHFVVKCLCAKF